MAFESQQIVVREATDADRDAIVSLYVDLEEHHRALQPSNPRYSLGRKRWRELVAKLLRDASGSLLVAIERETPVGFARLALAEKPWGLSCEVETMVVAPGHRGRGIGSRLLEATEEYALSHHAKAMRVTVLIENDDGRRFYEREGYSPIAIRYGKPVA